MKCIYFQKSINSLNLSFHWSFHAFHKCALFISQGVRLTADLSSCALHRRFFSCIFWVFCTALFESTFGECFQNNIFASATWSSTSSFPTERDSLLKILFESFIMKLHTIVIPNKQTNTKATRLAKKYFKTQSNTYLIKLKCSEVFRKSQSFELRYYAKITSEILIKRQISSQFLRKKTLQETLYFPY